MLCRFNQTRGAIILEVTLGMFCDGWTIPPIIVAHPYGFFLKWGIPQATMAVSMRSHGRMTWTIFGVPP